MGYKINKNSEGRYQVIKDGAKRATRVFDSYSEAEEYIEKFEKNPKKKKSKKAITPLKVFLALVLGIAIGFGIGVIAFNNYFNGLVFELIGDEEVVVRLDGEYQELGCVAKYNQKDISDNVKISYKKLSGETVSKLETSVASTYIVVYNLEYKEKNIDTSIMRHVFVDSKSVITSSGLSIHFLELGNKYTGDSVYIKAGDTDVLIDAGSRKSSSGAISSYINEYVEDNKLEFVIATHAHQDHIAGFIGTKDNPGIFDIYECDMIIDFPLHNTESSTYKSYKQLVDKEVAEGATHYNALQCYNNEDGAKREYELTDGVTLEILYNYFYENETSDENDYSVCVLISDGENNYLFTGDLEKEGEEKLVEHNDLPECKVYKAGHHGSKTSSSTALLEVIKPEIVCVCCCAGSTEYTTVNENTFPTQDFINRVSKYTDKIYVTSIDSNNEFGYTSFNGNIIVSLVNGVVTVNCSNNNTILKDTVWFKENRKWPV